ncbi:MAG: hypothetical protein PVG48_03750 [Candidatus Bathyarchaeota archaeon]|jgi:uncharacterized membrane protein (DUF2068 family)
MPLKSKLKVEKLGMLATSIFYMIAGVAEAIILALSNFSLIHVAPLAVLNLITAYGLFRMKKWTVFLVTILFFPAITFGASVLYASVTWQTFYPSVDVLLFHLALITYLILTLISLIYVVAVRNDFK